MTNEIAIIRPQEGRVGMPAMTIQDAATRRQAMVDFTKELMKADVDYGVIPGTGDKPTLLKPGAEKLATLFGLSPRFEVIDREMDWTGRDHGGEPFFYYQYRCQLWHGDLLAGEGVGSCNSWEKKYRYRTVYPERATDDDKANGKLETRKGRGGKSYQVYIVRNPDPADIVNTVDKMAQKRAMISAVLVTVNASEFFTQDVEDMNFSHIIDADWTEVQPAKPAPKPAQAAKPKPKPALAAPVDDGPPPEDEAVIYDTSAGEFFEAAASMIGEDVDYVKDRVRALGYTAISGKPAERVKLYRAIRDEHDAAQATQPALVTAPSGGAAYAE